MRLTGEGDLAKAIPTAFGLPSCMTDMVRRGLLKYMPTGILKDYHPEVEKARKKVRSGMAWIINESIGRTGLVEFDAED